mgnify:CR=1 FL=1
MPNHKYIGVTCKNTNMFKQNQNENKKYKETVVSFETICSDPRIEKIEKPAYQGALLEEKVEQMITEYLKNPIMLRLKNKIIVGCLHDKWFIVDGQHRLEMSILLYNRHFKQDNLVFCWYECTNDNELKNLFDSVNKDSIKNQYYVENNTYKAITMLDFTKKLKKYCKQYFSIKRSEATKTYCIEEFVELLDKRGFFELKHCKEADNAYEYLRSQNKLFYDIACYEINMLHNSHMYYEKEKNCINNKIIVSLKGNNFMDWMFDSVCNKAYHKMKKVKKDKISNYKREIVWKNEFNNDMSGKCPISFCNSPLNNITRGGWQCGHIVSEYNGGITEPYNLRPICKKCNLDMSSKNWISYDKKSYDDREESKNNFQLANNTTLSTTSPLSINHSVV